MPKAKKTDGIYYMSIYRFGYNLTAVGRTKEECSNALSDEYIKTYAEWNHLDESMCRKALLSPILEEDGEYWPDNPYNEFAGCYRNTFDEDEETRFYEFGKVVWE
ncbi:MAG: hypothetical protein J6W09_04460 [Bacteroidales bacterium]|nr:hypothetical protein [Bacteroidales bacterium]